jgi:hypothetical protein
MVIVSPDRIQGRIVRAKQPTMAAEAQGEISFWGVSLFSWEEDGSDAGFLVMCKRFGALETQTTSHKAT